MDYKFKIDKIIGLILQGNELEISMNFILDSDIAYDISKELLYELDANFEYQDGDSFDELLEANDILSLCVICSKDGIVRYILQPVCDNDGMTYPDEDSNIIYIQDSLYDCIDTDVFDGQVAILIDEEEEFNRIIEALKEEDYEECNHDCANCKLHEDTDDEDYEKEIDEEDELDELFEELTSEVLEDIMKNQDDQNSDFCLHCAIKDRIIEAYEIGYRDCIIDNGIVE
jgi:hypothetical protein